jgi:hypothetical protein
MLVNIGIIVYVLQLDHVWLKVLFQQIACYSNNQGFLNVSQTNSFFCILWLNLAHIVSSSFMLLYQVPTMNWLELFETMSKKWNEWLCINDHWHTKRKWICKKDIDLVMNMLDKGLHFNNLMNQIIYIGDWNLFNQNKKYHLQVANNKRLFLEVDMLMTKKNCEYIFLKTLSKITITHWMLIHSRWLLKKQIQTTKSNNVIGMPKKIIT